MNSIAITSLVGFTAAFTVTDRDTGNVLVSGTQADAEAIQSQIDSDTLGLGTNEIADQLADAVAGAMADGINLLVDAENAATVLAIFERYSRAFVMAGRMGIRTGDDLNQSCLFSCEAEDLPAINVGSMAEIAGPIFSLVEAMKALPEGAVVH